MEEQQQNHSKLLKKIILIGTVLFVIGIAFFVSFSSKKGNSLIFNSQMICSLFGQDKSDVVYEAGASLLKKKFSKEAFQKLVVKLGLDHVQSSKWRCKSVQNKHAIMEGEILNKKQKKFKMKAIFHYEKRKWRLAVLKKIP